MKSILFFSFLFLSNFILISCGTNADNKKALAAGSGSIDQIIARSGTRAIDKDIAMRDAKNRLMTGGGLFGKKDNSLDDLLSGNQNNRNITNVGLPINAILWKSSLEIIDFMPIASADAFSGLIITDWYSSPSNPKEKCKINIFIKGMELKSSNLKVNSFCQKKEGADWTDIEVAKENNVKIENAILNKAKKIRLSVN
jgi:hypothetical protein